VLEGTKQLFAVSSNLRRYVFIDDLLYFGADDTNDDNVDSRVSVVGSANNQNNSVLFPFLSFQRTHTSSTFSTRF